MESAFTLSSRSLPCTRAYTHSLVLQKEPEPVGRVSTASRTYGSTAHYGDEKSTCLNYFELWTENEQIDFVEHLLSRMCHYQHGHINQYLKPMLQRDFISALPGSVVSEILAFLHQVRSFGKDASLFY